VDFSAFAIANTPPKILVTVYRFPRTRRLSFALYTPDSIAQVIALLLRSVCAGIHGTVTTSGKGEHKGYASRQSQQF
jgi:hypothetical protein